jgi:hypothetical protein
VAKTVYTLEVVLMGGPVDDEFVERNPVVARTIEIRGDQTLERLHEAIFTAFDRDDEHLYEFQFGRGPHDSRGECYGVKAPVTLGGAFLAGERPVGDAAKKTLDSLGLKEGRSFGYWFDFGDDWYHQIDVLGVGEANTGAKYPRVVAREGASPPQYPDLEDEDGDWEEE